MWEGHVEALGAYGLVVCAQWVAGGRPDTCADSLRTDLATAGLHRVRDQAQLAAAGELPPWLGDEAVHRSHQSALVRKDPLLYGPLFAAANPEQPYVWPVRSGDTGGDR